jgi:hypothetical protein
MLQGLEKEAEDFPISPYSISMPGAVVVILRQIFAKNTSRGLDFMGKNLYSQIKFFKLKIIGDKRNSQTFSNFEGIH